MKRRIYCEEDGSADSDDDEVPSRTAADHSPPARKILKTLLTREVEKAFQDLQNEAPTLMPLKQQRAAALIPEFDPDSEECTITAWLKKIEQLGEIYGWDEKTKSFHLQDKLRGQARKWYNRLEEYDFSWEQWKQMLLRAFPKHRDYAGILEEMLNRRKLHSESMTKYYQEKVAMCFRCKLSDSATISCIIRGLPAGLQSNARAFQCGRPDELYEGFLCALDDYRPHCHDQRATQKDIGRPAEKKSGPVNPDIVPCPRCKKTGHLVRDCPQPDQRKCFKCGTQGHIAPRCPSNSKTSEVSAVKDIKLLLNYSDIYKKTAKVNGAFVKSYIDTGSQVNVLNIQVAKLLELEVTPTTIELKGFSGALIASRGEVNFRLEIDGLDVCCKAHLTDIDMNDINLLIGQPVINSDGVSLLVQNGTAVLQKAPGFPCEVNVSEESSRFAIKTMSDECLPPGTSIIKVSIVGNTEGNNVVTPARHYELQDVSYSIPATVLSGSTGYLKVINSGEKDVNWKGGTILLRAESCRDIQVSAIASNCLLLDKNCLLSAKNIHCASIASSSNRTIGGTDVDKINIGPIGTEEHKNIIELLSQFGDCFAANTQELGRTDLVKMPIKLTTDQPVFRRPYRLSHTEQEIVKSKISDLLSAGIIKESQSSYASPVVLVKKKNGDSRLCVDYRALNAITVRDRHPLPNIDDQVSKLAGMNYFTSLDLAQGYHQLLILPEDTHKTAFVIPQGHYEYNRVPFGLANAPSVFMRLMNKIINSINNPSDIKSSSLSQQNPEILAFLDDLLLPSIDVPTGIELLKKVLVKLRSENLKLNMQKCSFLKNTITYLGHEISPGSIQPGELKLSAVSQFPTPRNVHEIRQFIGLCSYFRKFIANFALIARPLTELTKKNAIWTWDEIQSKSFYELKQKLCSKPLLAIYDSKLTTEIHTDACKLGIAGMLLQKQNDDSLRPVMYFSRVTSREESVYYSNELETLAVVESLRRFRVYIVGKQVRVVTDCTAVRDTLTKRDLIPRIARWWLLIQEYDISIDYRPGDRMQHI